MSAADPGPAPEMNLRSKVLGALQWTALARLSAQVTTWGITLVVIRILKPADYGIMAMSEVFFGLLLMLSNAGLGSAIIQAEKLEDHHVRRMFGLLCSLNVVLFTALFLAAPLLGVYYEEPRVVAITRTLAIGFLLVPFVSVPSALLSRDIEFKRKSIVDLLAAVLAAIATLSAAIAGWGVWALVTGRLLLLFLQAVGLNLVHPCLRWPSFRLEGMGSLVRFGGAYTATTVLWFFYEQMDIFIAGRLLDSQSVGYYAVAVHLGGLISVKIMPLLNQVALPAYSRVQRDPSAVSYYFLKVARITALLLAPAFIGLASVAPEFVRIILGERYHGSIMPLMLLSMIMPMRMLSNLFSAPVYARGVPRVEFWNKLFALFVMGVAFYIGAQGGASGLALAWIVGFPIVFAFQLVKSAPVIGTTPGAVLGAVATPWGFAAAMAGVVWLFRAVPIGGALHLALLIAAGVGAYLAFVRVGMWGRAREVFDTVRRRKA